MFVVLQAFTQLPISLEATYVALQASRHVEKPVAVYVSKYVCCSWREGDTHPPAVRGFQGREGTAQCGLKSRSERVCVHATVLSVGIAMPRHSGILRPSWLLVQFPCVVLLFLGFGVVSVNGNPDAKRLYDDLLSSYNRLIRPVGNNNETITVWMRLRLSQLIDLVSTHK